MTISNKFQKSLNFFGLGANPPIEDPYQTEQIDRVSDSTRRREAHEPSIVPFTFNSLREASRIQTPLSEGDIVIINTGHLDYEDAVRIADFAAGVSLGVFGKVCLRNLQQGILAVVPPHIHVSEQDLLTALD
ncbi:MAG: cell division protein SepF [Corynebacterium sp.]|nr:cell division protein SepF [Corynebacterium sp.]